MTLWKMCLIAGLLWTVSAQSPTCELQPGGECVCGDPNVHSYCGSGSSASCPPENRLVLNSQGDYCRTFFRYEAEHILPDEWELLFDSYDYESILGSVFLEREFDSDTATQTVPDTWTPRGGLCQQDLRACAYTLGQQDNWLFSQHIKYPPGSAIAGGGYPTEVYLNITYRFSECSSRPTCFNAYVTLYRYDTNIIASPTDQTDNSNYLSTPLLGQGTENTDSRLVFTSGFTDLNILRSFTTPGSTGFHLGIRDSGTCGQVGRIFFYYTPCKAFQDGLVNYPELVRPPEGSPPNVAEACCAPNSHSTSLSFRAYSASDGRCERNVMCVCDAGYRLNMAGTGCELCPAGTYRTDNDPHETCLPCPGNTRTDVVAASVCDCIDNHFRTVEEEPSDDCTEPPGPPGNLTCDQITGTSLLVVWSPPTDTGGRTDIFYKLDYQAVTSTDDFIRVSRIDEISYNITNLEPTTRYRVAVIAENGVSDQDTRPGIESTRTSPILVCETGEGPPGVPSSVQVVDNIVFLWQPPKKPNGNITGYRVLLTYNSSLDNFTQLDPIDLDASTFVYVLRRDIVPENVTAIITVTARTSAGYGETSSPIVFVPFAPPVVELVRNVCSPQEMGLYIGVAAAVAAVGTALIFILCLMFYCICRKCCGSSKDDSYEVKGGFSNGVKMSEKINWT